MALERRMEGKVMEVRDKELKFQQRHYFIWVRLNGFPESRSVRLTNPAEFVDHYMVRPGVLASQYFDTVRSRHIAPALVTLSSFWHFAVVRGQKLTPSIAFTSVSIHCIPK